MFAWLKSLLGGCSHRWAVRNLCPMVSPDGALGVRCVMRCADCGAIRMEELQ